MDRRACAKASPLGGLTVADNLEMLCHRHNQDVAWLELGAERMRERMTSGAEAEWPEDDPRVHFVDEHEMHDEWVWEDPPEMATTPTA